MRKLDGYKNKLDTITQGETGQVPLYRSYGVKKKVNPLLIAFNLTLGRALAILIFGFEFLVIAICTVTMYLYADILICTLVTLILVFILLYIHTRVLRRRLEFVSRLKRLCKKNGYRLDFVQNFWSSFVWDDNDSLDFVLKAGKYTYYVKYVTPTKPLTSFIFASKDQIIYTKHARNNVFTLIFGFKDKSKSLRLQFPKAIDDKDKYSVKSILVNPKPRDIFVKNSSGATVPTGTGEKIYGYTIFTGKGFIESVKRNAEERDEEIKF